MTGDHGDAGDALGHTNSVRILSQQAGTLPAGHDGGCRPFWAFHPLAPLPASTLIARTRSEGKQIQAQAIWLKLLKILSFRSVDSKQAHSLAPEVQAYGLILGDVISNLLTRAP